MEQLARQWLGLSKNLLASGITQCSTAYNLTVTNLVLLLLKYNDKNKTSADDSAISTTSLVGAVVGQVFFAFAGDALGRKLGLFSCGVLQVIGAIGTGASFGQGYWMMCIFRFLLGAGLGGSYPLTAAISAESASHASKRGRDMAKV